MVHIENPVTVGEFAKLSGRSVGDIITKLMHLGFMATINQHLDFDTLGILASEINLKLEIKLPPVSQDVVDEDKDLPESMRRRYPVVTVMGHVDHGKTSLLDCIRRSHVTASEAGGITQHIGAYQVDLGDDKIVFLDTPGHEAFTQMRARGAKVTDIAILVVAADDGVMPQTIEALNHAKAANVPIIVAVNKMDKPSADPGRIKQQLTEYGIVTEEWGGDTIFVGVSALKRQGIDDLLAAVLTVAEVLELKANPDRSARGIVIEAHIDKGKGPIATLLIQKGTLNVGDAVVAGSAYGRVRAMVNDKGKRLKKAGPSTPLELHGLSMAPQAGDEFVVVKDDKVARLMAEKAAEMRRIEMQRPVQKVSLEDFFKQVQAGQMKNLNLIIKGDVQGSVEALKPAVEKLNNREVEVKVIHVGVGPVNESDILLAKASNAIIIGFNVRAEANARKAAEQEQVDVRFYRIIYEVLDDITAALKGMLAPVFKENVIGQAEVRVVFRVTGSGVIAGSMVTEGKITRQAGVRLLRGGIIIYEGKIGSLKRFKDDAREVASGYECGIGLDNYDDVKEGDIIEAFVREQVLTP
ncbi:MAG: Translation initiation factor IF-2 [Firmicutes bacterium]|nr:Translation initiation factor IF-2 [Bacillota bacterium]